MKKYYEPGTISVITGNMGSGKTDIALRFGEKALEKNPNLQIITNILMSRKTERVNVTTSLTKMLNLMVEIKEGLLILDEAGIFASSGSSSVKRDIGQWEQMLKLSRKFGLATIWIDQRGIGSVPPTVRELATYHMHKPEMFKLELYLGMGDNARLIDTRRLTPDDRTTLPFDTLSIGSFKMDLPPKAYTNDKGKIKFKDRTIRDVFDFLADVPSPLVRGALKSWMVYIDKATDDRPQIGPGSEGEDPLGTSPLPSKQEALCKILEIWHEQGLKLPKTSELAYILDLSTHTITNYKTIWKKSKGLLPDPDD